jgi:hypothetical protein
MPLHYVGRQIPASALAVSAARSQIVHHGLPGIATPLVDSIAGFQRKIPVVSRSDRLFSQLSHYSFTLDGEQFFCVVEFAADNFPPPRPIDSQLIVDLLGKKRLVAEVHRDKVTVRKEMGNWAEAFAGGVIVKILIECSCNHHPPSFASTDQINSIPFSSAAM